MSICPCNPEKEFEQCCGPYLAGDKDVPTAEALMRSRYSAYTKEDYDYVVSTCHSSSRPEREEFNDMAGVDWAGLEVLRTEAGGVDDDKGVVEFVACYNSAGATYNHHEISNFVKEDGKWYYVDGDLIGPQQARSLKVGRNEPCPCGSGKKYKKCCLRN